jgi:hypothetical protein
MTAYDFSALTIDGIDQPLSQYRGHPLVAGDGSESPL